MDTKCYRGSRIWSVRRVGWAKRAAHINEVKNTYNILMENLEERKPFERYRRKWEDNINMNLRNFDFIHLARDGFQLRVLVKVVIIIFSRTIFIYLTTLSVSGYIPDYVIGFFQLT
jgi:hypothetical protein